MRPTFILSVTLLFSVISLRSLAGDAPLTIPVWPDVPPGSEGKPTEEKVRLAGKDGEHVVSNVHRPTLTVYLPAAGTATGAGVVICPGGGHRELWTDHEGHNVARWLAAHGVAGFVLKYRLAREEGSTYKVEVHSLADLQRAVQLVRSHAGEWRVGPDRLGGMGFSAGGGLAPLGSMRVFETKPSAADSVGPQRSTPGLPGFI